MSGVALVPIAVLLAVLGTDVWVYVDATAHAEAGNPVVFALGPLVVDTPSAWFALCLVLWILAFPVYVTSRH